MKRPGKLVQALTAVLGLRKHIKQILHCFIAVGVGRANQHISLLVDHIGEAGIVIKGQGEAVYNTIHLILLYQVSPHPVFQCDSHKQVKYIDTRYAADMGVNDAVAPVRIQQYSFRLFVNP